MLYSYKLRICLLYTTVEKVLKTLHDAKRYSWVCEKLNSETNPHMHMFIRTTVKLQTQRKRIQNVVSAKGNGAYSLRPLQEKYPIGYLSYLKKEGHVTNVNIPKKILEEVDKHEEEILKILEEKRKKKRTPVWKQIMAKISLDPDDQNPYRTICHHVVQHHVDNALMIRMFTLKCYADTIYLNLCPNMGFGYIMMAIGNMTREL